MNEKQIKIILCEDELIISLDLKRILKKFGYTVSSVYKSAEGLLANIQNDKPDIVLADVNLKGKMDGIELAGILIRDYGVRVIFLTGSPIHNFKEKLKGLECDFILKPFQESALKEKIENTITLISPKQ